MKSRPRRKKKSQKLAISLYTRKNNIIYESRKYVLPLTERGVKLSLDVRPN